ncbi:hypothetical protein E4U42_007864 [Claviceps africana]|uniref:Origin recognition complex subunit 2 n=1 Tax=Claviceps africana TaxID=83212 RepID=A0A8K0J1D6_9HYPO|nr:hypothetical protein E4U42_007864 [Claviceps africana]
MPRRKPVADDSQEAIVSDSDAAASSRKRSVDAADLDAADLDATPTKRPRRRLVDEALLSGAVVSQAASATEDAETEANDEPIGIPPAATATTTETETAAATPRRRGRPPKAAASQTSTPSQTPSKTPARSIFATPVKRHQAEFATPTRKAADRSARKKSARALIETVVGHGLDSDADDADDDVLVREIYQDSDGEEHDEDEDAGAAASAAAALGGGDATPSKTGRTRTARAKRASSPTPPRHLPAHELYFAYNKPGRPKTSDNTLGSLALLTHDEYFSILHDHGHVDRHSRDVEYLEDLHADLFPQWLFELSQGYSLCLYGFGSKRNLLLKEGVAFVLKSLPENAKKLFQLLVGEVLLAGMEDEGPSSRDDDAAGVEYRMVYNKAVEEFICSSEMAFRTLLKEFHDHQMITSRKDALGTELLSVPFPQAELEAILEDLTA